ncbi:MAG: tetratricopeptide repeat protein [Candidatus Marinimicrobia bacterium]|nr:tetratricopeptide repeat protein [Candidatus Neomarinimicrobiota bacterium]MBT3632935.1 tetratricopeptide repeat protein [Candidatus Neomarinimicrobiota bacterium]MBT3682045.1 tetratricopeptide repeat protein [Candidatus Neomarinimicrobiota bacterium]MBT3758926.1 tetratricopeptide repeat protein [Candidatus Neomarinimicrobiota bacterium]MBT3895175.1 tetratricopeptide repeat protein [Candidatus Neomarinimicrobiota bacterium]
MFISPVFSQSTIAQIDSINQIQYQYIISHLQESVTTFEKNVENSRNINYEYGEAVALDKLALALGISGAHDKANSAFLKAATIFEELEDYNKLSSAYGGYGYGLKRRNMTSANKYMRMGISIAEQYNLNQNLTTLYDNYGVLKLLEEQLDSAFYFYSKALGLKRQLADSVGIPYSLNKLAELFAAQGQYNKAFEYLAESDSIRSKEQGDFGRAENLAYHADIYQDMQDFDTAISYYKQAITKGIPLNYAYLVQYSYQQIAELYELTGNFRDALANQKQYMEYKENELNTQMNEKIAELEITYETEKKDRQLSEKNLALRNRSLQLTSAFLFILLISISFYIIYRNNKIKMTHKQHRMQLQNQKEQAELQQKLTEEKLQLSSELHDNIGSNLTFMINSLDNLTNSKNTANINQKLNSIGSFCRESIDDLRNSIWALKQDDGDTKLLILKVQELRQKLQKVITKPEIIVSDQTKNIIPINSTTMLNLFRIVQEGIQNAIKHANANRITLTWSETQDTINITIEDDGIGIDHKTLKYGNGLTNIKTRSKKLSGSFSIKASNPGTSIAIQIPKK